MSEVTAALVMQRLRVVVVGAGKMGLHHARAISRLGDLAELVAIVDPSDAVREAARGVLGAVAVYATLEEVLERTGVDVVHVCTPPVTHFAVALAAIGHGCHVYIEKPVAGSTDEARQILDAASARGRLVCAGHQVLFETPMAELRRFRRAIGRVVHVDSYFSFRTVRRSPTGRAPLRADLQLLDILPHPVYLLLAGLEGEGNHAPAELLGLDIGPPGTLHAIVRKGGTSGTLTVTLDGRPIESYLRVVGSNGELYADFVRGTLLRQIGPGISGIDKALSPYRAARQLVIGTTRALAARVLARQRSYPGLVELFGAFYRAILEGKPSPTSPESIVETMSIWDTVAARLSEERPVEAPAISGGQVVLVTGGTGLLGRAVVEELGRGGYRPRVLARREPAAWERVPGAEYHAVDLGESCPADLVAGCIAVIHCAAETAGGWEQHERNSVRAAENVFRAALGAGVDRFVHVSSMGVLAAGRKPLSESSPLEPGRARGAYVWGKAESERALLALAGDRRNSLRIVRPGALVDYADFVPPGRLGKRLGNLFVAPGWPSQVVGVVDVRFAAKVLVWMVDAFDRAPEVLNLLDPVQPSRRDLLRSLRERNPDLRVVWLPPIVLNPLSLALKLVQRVLRPGKTPVDVARVFASQTYDLGEIRRVAQELEGERGRRPGAVAGGAA